MLGGWEDPDEPTALFRVMRRCRGGGRRGAREGAPRRGGQRRLHVRLSHVKEGVGDPRVQGTGSSLSRALEGEPAGLGGAGRVQSGERESPAPLNNLNFTCKVVEDALKDFKVPQWDLL